jgi:hypothetical protein
MNPAMIGEGVQDAIEERFVELAFPAFPSPMVIVRALAPAAPCSWALQPEAGRAAAVVLGFVGVPALVAAGAAVAVFAITAAVLLAPLAAVGLAWLAWWENRRPSAGSLPEAAPP